MKSKIIMGAIMFAILLGLIALSKYAPYVLDITILLLCVFGTREIYLAIKRAGHKPIPFPLILIMLLAYPMMYFFSIDGLIITLLFTFLVTFLWYVFDNKRNFSDFMTTLFLAYYPCLMFIVILFLNMEYGILPIMLAVGGAVGCDIFAYFGGSIIKGPKIFPKLSPKKTYAGSIIGLFGGAFGSWVMYKIFEAGNFPSNIIFRFDMLFNNPSMTYTLLGFCCAVFAELGDLGASKIKREVGIKDYSTALRSHGGVMDRLDSILFSMIFITTYMVLVHGNA
ncbi:MAG: phosphatidate cytidylyltransferase [Christensenellales bacterium]|jgi:phosphatidate cytidylyltransferase